jgi:hypothetical protein
MGTATGDFPAGTKEAKVNQSQHSVVFFGGEKKQCP